MEKIPKLLTRRRKTMKKTQKLLTKGRKTMEKIPESLSNAGELLVNPRSSEKVKRVAASRLGLESFFQKVRLRELLTKPKRKKNKY